MLGNTDFQVHLPTETHAQIGVLCRKFGWTRGVLLGALVDNCPAIEMRTATPPLHIKKADSPHLFKAHIDSVTNRRIEYICELRNWSRRDMMIHLLDHYINNVLNKGA